MKTQIIFIGNGPLADYAKAVLDQNFEIIFHARTKEDLEEVKRLKTDNPDAFGILASFGVIIKSDVLDLFEPEGILNIHPSLLPKYRGSSPIETAILNGDKEFSYSIMKLVKAMDAGPIYFQETVTFDEEFPEKDLIYKTLSEKAATWISNNLTEDKVALSKLSVPQDDTKATYTAKLDKSMSHLDENTKTAEELLNEVRAFKGFPKSKHDFYGLDCIVLSAHVSEEETPLSLLCADKKYLVIDEIQPAGRKPMNALSFLNGYAK